MHFLFPLEIVEDIVKLPIKKCEISENCYLNILKYKFYPSNKFYTSFISKNILRFFTQIIK